MSAPVQSASIALTDSGLHYSRAGIPVDLEAKYSPNLLNSAIYLISLSQQVSTFAINFQVGLCACCEALSSRSLSYASSPTGTSLP